MKNLVTPEAIRCLQKDGKYKFSGISYSETEQAAERLAQAAMNKDRKNGIRNTFYGIARDALGYYFATII